MDHDLTTLERAVIAGITIADETWGRVRALVDERLPADSFLLRLREILERYEPIWVRTLSDSVLAAWIEAHLATINKAKLTLPPAAIPGGGNFGPPSGPIAIFRPRPDDPPPVVTFPKLEHAVNDLAARRVVTADEYYALDDRARSMAFTVAKIGTEDTIAKIQAALVRDVDQGLTLRDFRQAVNEVAGVGALSPSHVETVYRTNVLGAYSAGQRRVLQHPLVRTEFPYVLWSATHDSRVRPDHLAMEHAGIQGGPVYRADDPEVRRVWPPASFNCRCKIVLLTLEMAADRYGIKEAAEWLRTGHPPQFPAYVERVPLETPKGWARTFDAAA